MAPNTTCDFLTADELADKLSVDRKTVYAGVERKEIPAIRIGRCIRIPRAWYEARKAA